MKTFPLKRQILLTLWTVMALGILWADYRSGPEIALAYFFFLPVIFAARYNGAFWGYFFAIVLPLIRWSFHFFWKDSLALENSFFNLAIRSALLVGAAFLVDRVTRQAQEIRVLRGSLPICSICKKIRDARGNWSPVESYIAKHSEADFSHTICPQCGKNHYSQWMEDKVEPR